MTCDANKVACHDFDVALMQKDIRERFSSISINGDKDSAVFKDFLDARKMKYPDIFGCYKLLGASGIMFSIEHRAHNEQWQWADKETEDDSDKFTAKQYNSKFFLDLVDEQQRMAKIIHLIQRGCIVIESNRYHRVMRDSKDQVLFDSYGYARMEPPPSILGCSQEICMTSPLDYFDMASFDITKFKPKVVQSYPTMAPGVFYKKRRIHDSLEVSTSSMRVWSEKNLITYIRELHQRYQKMIKGDMSQMRLNEYD